MLAEISEILQAFPVFWHHCEKMRKNTVLHWSKGESGKMRSCAQNQNMNKQTNKQTKKQNKATQKENYEIQSCL